MFADDVMECGVVYFDRAGSAHVGQYDEQATENRQAKVNQAMASAGKKTIANV